jgi:hypothetical protein
VIAEHPDLGLAVPNHSDYSQRPYNAPNGLAYTIIFKYDEHEVILVSIRPVPRGVFD